MSRLFGPIRQIAFVIPSLAEGTRYWTETLGVGPFFVLHDVAVENHRYRGRPGPPPRGSIALANSGNLQIELIQVNDDRPSVWREFGDLRHGGLHHVSAWTTRVEYDATMARLLALGVEVLQEGTITASGVRFAYFATDAGPGRVIYEIADLLEPSSYALVQMVADAARGWDGTDPVREIPLSQNVLHDSSLPGNAAIHETISAERWPGSRAMFDFDPRDSHAQLASRLMTSAVPAPLSGRRQRRDLPSTRTGRSRTEGTTDSPD